MMKASSKMLLWSNVSTFPQEHFAESSRKNKAGRLQSLSKGRFKMYHMEDDTKPVLRLVNEKYIL